MSCLDYQHTKNMKQYIPANCRFQTLLFCHFAMYNMVSYILTCVSLFINEIRHILPT